MLLKPSRVHVLFIHRVMQILLQGIGHLTACLELSRDSRHGLGDDQGRTGLINENGILSPSGKMKNGSYSRLKICGRTVGL